MGKNLPLKLTVESVHGEHMTWGVSLITVEDLYLWLPGRRKRLRSTIRDLGLERFKRNGGFGEVKKVNPVAGESLETARMRRTVKEVVP